MSEQLTCIMSRPENLIEISYEVANKVGGIHQVLASKSSKMKDFYGDNYFTIGPYKEEAARDEFAPREEHPYQELFQQLEEKHGIKCYYGVWKVPGSPKTVLVDPSGLEKSTDDIKNELWKKYGVDSLNAPEDFDEPVKWSYAVGKLVKGLEEELEGETVVHLHEWLSGAALTGFESPSVFTTHATVLGRALSNSDFDLGGAIKKGEIEDKLAEEYGVKPKHQMEKAAAHEANVFTTVSKTTGREAEAVLDKRPEVILSNGFNVEEYPSLEELSYNHTRKKSKMTDFLQAYFEPYYDVDLEDDPRIMFVSGRYEFHNKGLDMLVDALAEVNERPGDDFFVFFFVPSDVKGAKMSVLENMSLFDELEEYIDSVIPEIRSRLLKSITSGERPEDISEVVDDGKADSLSNSFHSRSGENPPLCAFDLNYSDDKIISRLRERGLNNSENDRVKVIFYPTYLSVGDKLLSMDYNDAIVASSAGIFPSYYEPWGYTPVETAANGALSVTTDMAGFGKFLQDKTDEEERKGIKILEREDKSYEEASNQLADIISDITEYSKTEITERKHNARKLAQLTSWNKLGENYREAHDQAVNMK
ncbi:glycogen/starch synthase [Candidatus Nanosalina sp. VS9-1]|uniref:glycogen/starch synthase n=1 Tax=Candidatus Nanosalina sp. VS9-1 TaxID=3388566 RepID=UPI0039DF4D85